MSKPSHEVNPCLATSMDRMLPEQQHLKNVVAVPRLTAQAERPRICTSHVVFTMHASDSSISDN